MKEVRLSRRGLSVEAASLLACLATVLEVPASELPELSSNGDPSRDWNVVGWLGSLGIGLVPVASPTTFAWPGPWIARVREGDGPSRFAVMYGSRPSGVVWDPVGQGVVDSQEIEEGFVLAAEDIALGMPLRDAPSWSTGSVEELWTAADRGESGRTVDMLRVTPGVGVAGYRYAAGRGTFPSGRTGSALTLIEAEVCESFSPPLMPDEHRRNVVTRGVRLNAMVGREFTLGRVRCRGVRLCEPCATMQRYVERPIIRALVHRGGLRADVLTQGQIRPGDSVALVEATPRDSPGR